MLCQNLDFKKIKLQNKINTHQKMDEMLDNQNLLFKDIGFRNSIETKLQAIILKAVQDGGGTFIVISEKRGGALSKKFWRHPAITKLLSRRR